MPLRLLTSLPPSGEGPAPPELVSVGVLGKRIGAQLLEHETSPSGLDVRTVRACVSDFERDLTQGPTEVLVVELELLGENPEQTLRRLVDRAGAHLSLVLYDYASRHRLGTLERCCLCRPLQQPVSVGQLRRTVLDAARGNRARSVPPPAPSPPDQRIPSRRFSDSELGRLREVVTTVECECPNHLATLVASLAAFERYAAGCANQSAADEDMHALLHRQTARARDLLERALQRLIEHEGIQI